MSGFMMEEGGGSDSFNATTNHAYSSENISFNSSLISTYSAEEEIIQQRGRKSPIKQSLINQHQFQQQLPQFINTREIFLKLKQSSMQSPEKASDHQNHLLVNSLTINNTPNDTSSCSASSSNSTVVNDNIPKSKRNLNKTLLRTPVKRRLKLRRDSSKTIKKFRRRC